MAKTKKEKEGITDAPWNMTKGVNSDKSIAFNLVGSDGKKIIAEINTLSLFGEEIAPEALANGRLLKAAPDLLRDLKLP